jgi:hypothetical protein
MHGVGMKTKSEELFEAFLSSNNLTFEKIKEETTPKPDYLVSIGSAQIMFEVKELAEDKNFGVVKNPAYLPIKSYSRTLGEHVRRRIESARRQIQYGADQDIPSVLLIYNNIDPVFQLFATEPMDFIAAMYGAYTILLNWETRAASEVFNGAGGMLQERKKNTSFSAVGHLCDRGGMTNVTLFENVFAKVKIPYDQIGPCFDVPLIKVSTEPMALP